MNTKIDTFIFDCFGVICDPVLNSWYRDNMVNRGLEDRNLQDVFTRLDLGELSEDDIVTYLSELEGINSTKEKIREEIDAYLRLDEDLAKVILKLKNKGFKTMLLSNAGAFYFESKIYKKYPQFKGLFNEIIISSDIKMVKPDKKIYLYALDKIKSNPEESLFIDDNQANVDGAIATGINGVLYTDLESFLDYIKTIGINLEE